MRITNIENWRNEIETVMKDTFYYVSAFEKIRTADGMTVDQPIKVEKEGKPWITLEVMYDGSVVLWDENWKIYSVLDTQFYRNKMAMLCGITKQIMQKDKYCTMF